MSNCPRHLLMIAPNGNLECASRIIHMINSFCEAGSKVSVVCPPQRSNNASDLARLLHYSATVYAVPEYFRELECYDLEPYLGRSLSTLRQRLYARFMSIGINRSMDETIKTLPSGVRQVSERIADMWHKRARRTIEEALATHHYYLHYLAQQLPPSMVEKYRRVINLDCYDYFFFIQTLIINKTVEPVDAIICHDLWSLPVGCLVKELLGITLLYDTHEIGTCVISDPVNKEVALENEGWMYELCDRFITVNASCGQYYTNLFPFLQPLIITNAHRTSADCPSDIPTIKQRLALPTQTPLAVYVGSLHPLSHLDRFIQAIGLCQSDLHLAVLGAEGDIERYRQIASNLDLIDKRVFFLGRVNFQEVLSTIYGADFGIIPNIQRHANHPWLISSSKLFDYVQAEMPIISDHGLEIQKILDEFAIGQTVDFQDEPKTIAKLLDDFFLRIKNGDFSRAESRRAKSSLIWPKNVVELIMTPCEPADETSNRQELCHAGLSDIVTTPSVRP